MSITKSNIFQFKKFVVNQNACGMKVNTDGVLLGALTKAENPNSILDIGTGTGVIALMLAQRFPDAQIEALEIDAEAAETARVNFANSEFSDRLKSLHSSFQHFSKEHPDKKYDLIVSNPPFFTRSFKNPDSRKHVARHAGDLLFTELVAFAEKHLSKSGHCYFILPLDATSQIIEEGVKAGLHLQQVIHIRSSVSKPVYRQIIGLGFEGLNVKNESLIIYQAEKVYSEQYQQTLKEFLIIF